MSRLDVEAITARIDRLLEFSLPTDRSRSQYEVANELLQATLTLTSTVYGPASKQEAQLLHAAKSAHEQPGHISIHFHRDIWPVAMATLRAMKGDIEAGLVSNIQARAIGEVVADFLLLAKEALAEASDGGKNVAAVLAAAAFEDAVRKMGTALASVHDRRALADVLTALKAAKVLEGAPLTTAQSYLKFRNDALHADWAKIDRAVVASWIAFVEQLILTHFG